MSKTKKAISTLLSTAGVEINGSNPWDIQVNENRFYDRILAKGSLGLGESYMESWWNCEDLSGLFQRLLQGDLHEHAKYINRSTYALLAVKSKLLNLQSKSRVFGSGGAVHYNLGNPFYRAMLDPEMVYSCGYWKDADSLNEAQLKKFDLICRKLSLKPGMKLLEIGCGWGGFLKYAVQNFGVKATGATISSEQAALAKDRCKGLDAEVKLQDYRTLQGHFDRIVSIGMFEHVGPKNYREFMKMAHRCLNPDGLFLLHTIGGNTSDQYSDPWFDKYIFPDSVIPSIAQIGKSIEGLFKMEDWHNFGPDYDKTLMAWHSNFESNWSQFKQDMDETFYRMWRYYLLSCAGAFRARHVQLWQIVLSPNGVHGGYQNVR